MNEKASPAGSHGSSHAGSHAPAGSMPALALAALGIVFGDIGTSPLYTLAECIHGEHGVGTTAPAVLGVLSLIFWSLTMVVTVKYLMFIMRADNRGEGGILALLALLPTRPRKDHSVSALTILVLIGAALLYGDGVITPAISVLSAVEGLGVATNALQPYVVPLTCVILVALFAIQRHGTGGIGRFFGPIMVLWFAAIGVLGVLQIVKAPGVLAALSPVWGVTYLATHGLKGTAILGAVVLAVTGGEALYADMGHFGPKPIRLGWLVLVFPTLVLSYFGQGALILSAGADVDNPFFSQVPQGPATYALVILSTLATVIASQALISGVFSLTQQATQLGFFPRTSVKQTSHQAEGQIYVPELNWALMIACVLLVFGFQASSKLAAAYGIAVSGTMGITSVCYYNVARQTCGWPVIKAAPLLALFLLFDVPFFLANLVKFVDGGYVPIGIAAIVCSLMLIWRRGRSLLQARNAELSAPVEKFREHLDQRLIGRLPETTVFLSGPTEGIPRPMNQYATRFRVLGEKAVVLTVHMEHVPVVDEPDRVKVRPMDEAAGLYRVEGHVGFMETPDVPALLRLAVTKHGLPIDLDNVRYVLARVTLLATDAGKMGRITESLFSFMMRNARSASDYFCLPADHVIELGTQLDL
jgi:KUP system potassium uptake protein